MSRVIPRDPNGVPTPDATTDWEPQRVVIPAGSTSAVLLSRPGWPKITIQNLSGTPVYIGPDETVTSETGWPMYQYDIVQFVLVREGTEVWGVTDGTAEVELRIVHEK